MPDINDVGIDDGLAEPNTRAQGEVTNSVVIERASHLQTGNRIWTQEETHIQVVSIVLVECPATVIVGTNGIAGAVLSDIVEAQIAGGNLSSDGDAEGLRRQKAHHHPQTP
jgi:hypothetical protein